MLETQKSTTLIAEQRMSCVDLFLQDSEQDPDLAVQDVANQQEIEDLFDELEDLSDSGPEMDTISVLSTPKPKLRCAEHKTAIFTQFGQTSTLKSTHTHVFVVSV